MPTRAAFLLIVLCGCAGAVPAVAQTPTDNNSTFVFRYSLKASALISHLPNAPALFPDRDSATGFWRLRMEPTVRVSDEATVELAFEQRVRLFSSAAGVMGGGVLPMDAPTAFRIRQLDWTVSASAHSAWRAEVDRAALHLRTGMANVTIGRQAIGWGRGVLFSAVDLFAPFTPLEADREWRRGVDAVRADIRISDRISVDGVGAFGRDMDHSIVAARLRGYAGNVDVELLGGRRARDLLGGVTTSAAVGDVEIHGEFAAFRTPGAPGAVAFVNARAVVKGLAGGSYRIPLGNGVLVYGEYHYSGFGAPSAAGILAQLADPTFQERYFRGDTQILGRHALAVVASYECGPELSVTGEWLQSPADGSGVMVPSATLTYGDRVSMVLSGYVPYGRAPVGSTLRSDFGATPLALVVQVRLYR